MHSEFFHILQLLFFQVTLKVFLMLYWSMLSLVKLLWQQMLVE